LGARIIGPDDDPVGPLEIPDRRPFAQEFRVGDDRDIVRRSIAQAGVTALERARFHELSSGQKQRVLIARALAAEPALLVLDEPTSGTDPAAERAIMDLLRSLHAEQGLAIVMATHNLGLVANYAGRIALVDRERQLFRLGTAAEILTEHTLTHLYGREIRVREIEGWRTVVAGGAPC
jgi:ABC-type cobalamin/Fe3+-siderophores transport system ATPase subunit